MCRTDRVRLEAHLRLGTRECGAISADAHNGEITRFITKNFAREDRAAFDELGRRELVCRGGGARDDVRHAATIIQQQRVFVRRQKARREAGAVDRGPEAVSRTSEVMADRGGVQAGIDAAEQDVEAVRDDVANGLAAGGLEVFAIRLQKLTANPPMYFRDPPSGVSASIRYGEFSACANSSPRRSLMSTGR